MLSDQEFPRYNPSETYEWNFEHAPDPMNTSVPHVPGEWRFCGLKVDSPLGIPAGPLLNGRWVLYYASLGFDVLTYKTVRSSERTCYPLPNLQPVATSQLLGNEMNLPATNEMQPSWAVSFGMPSKSPDYWRADIEYTRNELPKGKLLSVSVVGSIQPDWSIDDLAADYAQCARDAVDSGADCIETNFSCPNVSTCDGQLFQQPQSAATVAAQVRNAIGHIPYLIKIGHMGNSEDADALLDAVSPFIDALAMTNSVATTVSAADGSLLFNGERRGICGEATRTASIAQTRLFGNLIADKNLDVRIIGVGGASNADHIREYLQAGAEAVHIATAAMQSPSIALRIREDLSQSALITSNPPSASVKNG